jgi:hypothetical protein
VRKVAVALFVLAVVPLVVWAAQGRHYFTLTEKLVKERVVDEFGDQVEKNRWEPALAIGLLDAAGPAFLALGGTGGLLLFLARRRDRRRARGKG